MSTTEHAITEPSHGRSRDPGRDEAIIDAAIGLLVHDGYDRLFTEGAARVGKATAYRRWNSKAELVNVGSVLLAVLGRPARNLSSHIGEIRHG